MIRSLNQLEFRFNMLRRSERELFIKRVYVVKKYDKKVLRLVKWMLRTVTCNNNNRKRNKLKLCFDTFFFNKNKINK